MKRSMYMSRNRFNTEVWNFKPVWLIKEHKNTWRIWGLKFPLSRLVHKEALGERISEL